MRENTQMQLEREKDWQTDKQWSVRTDGMWSRPAAMAAWDVHQLWQCDSHHSSPHTMTMTVLHVHLSDCLPVSVAASLEGKALCNYPTCCWGSVVVVVSLLIISYKSFSLLRTTHFQLVVWVWTVVIITLLLFSCSIIRVFALIKLKSSQPRHSVSVTLTKHSVQSESCRKKGSWAGKPEFALYVSQCTKRDANTSASKCKKTRGYHSHLQRARTSQTSLGTMWLEAEELCSTHLWFQPSIFCSWTRLNNWYYRQHWQFMSQRGETGHTEGGGKREEMSGKWRQAETKEESGQVEVEGVDEREIDIHRIRFLLLTLRPPCCIWKTFFWSTELTWTGKKRSVLLMLTPGEAVLVCMCELSQGRQGRGGWARPYFFSDQWGVWLTTTSQFDACFNDRGSSQRDNIHVCPESIYMLGCFTRLYEKCKCR